MTECIFKRILAVLFITSILFIFIKKNTVDGLRMVSEFLCQEEHYSVNSLTMNSIESNYCDNLWNRDKLFEFNSSIVSSFGNTELYTKDNIFISKDRYIMSPSKYTSTDFEVEQVEAFSDFLSQNDIGFIYINEPTKYLSDKEFEEEFYVETYSNRNADLFLQRIEQAGINNLDLRQKIVDEDINIKEMFYRTDHHWTVPTGLWAAKNIASALNQNCGYQIDLNLYDENNFESFKYEDSWLGEQGRKVGKSYVGLDGFEEIKPKYRTNYWFKDGVVFAADGSRVTVKAHSGTFNDFINEEVYTKENDIYKDLSWHYSYNQLNVINEDVDYGKVLLIGDSYNQVVEPFISLGVHEVDSIILRDCDDTFSLRQYILDNEYDTVVVVYAQFMIGAHDEEFSANKRMFEFNR